MSDAEVGRLEPAGDACWWRRNPRKNASGFPARNVHRCSGVVCRLASRIVFCLGSIFDWSQPKSCRDAPDNDCAISIVGDLARSRGRTWGRTRANTHLGKVNRVARRLIPTVVLAQTLPVRGIYWGMRPSGLGTRLIERKICFMIMAACKPIAIDFIDFACGAHFSVSRKKRCRLLCFYYAKFHHCCE